jgi:hypothetical protein
LEKFIFGKVYFWKSLFLENIFKRLYMNIDLNMDFNGIDNSIQTVYKKSIKPGIINPIERNVITSIINFDTRFDKDKSLVKSSNEYTLEFPTTFQDVISLKIHSIELPNFLFNVSKYYKNNTFEIMAYQNIYVVILPSPNSIEFQVKQPVVQGTNTAAMRELPQKIYEVVTEQTSTEFSQKVLTVTTTTPHNFPTEMDIISQGSTSGIFQPIDDVSFKIISPDNVVFDQTQDFNIGENIWDLSINDVVINIGDPFSQTVVINNVNVINTGTVTAVENREILHLKKGVDVSIDTPVGQKICGGDYSFEGKVIEDSSSNIWVFGFNELGLTIPSGTNVSGVDIIGANWNGVTKTTLQNEWTVGLWSGNSFNSLTKGVQVKQGSVYGTLKNNFIKNFSTTIDILCASNLVFTSSQEIEVDRIVSIDVEGIVSEHVPGSSDILYDGVIVSKIGEPGVGPSPTNVTYTGIYILSPACHLFEVGQIITLKRPSGAPYFSTTVNVTITALNYNNTKISPGNIASIINNGATSSIEISHSGANLTTLDTLNVDSYGPITINSYILPKITVDKIVSTTCDGILQPIKIGGNPISVHSTSLSSSITVDAVPGAIFYGGLGHGNVMAAVGGGTMTLISSSSISGFESTQAKIFKDISVDVDGVLKNYFRSEGDLDTVVNTAFVGQKKIDIVATLSYAKISLEPEKDSFFGLGSVNIGSGVVSTVDIIKPVSSNVDITVPDGKYSKEDLMTQIQLEIQKHFSGATVLINPITGKTEFNMPNNISLPLSKLGYMLGFRKAKIGAQIVSDVAANINYRKYFYLSVDDFKQMDDNILIFNGKDFVSKKILAKVQPKNNLYLKRNYFGPVTLKHIKFSLLDHFGEIMDLKGIDYSFSIIVERLYRF